jgi:hypothetical protein
MDEATCEKRLSPFRHEILAWIYNQIAAKTHAIGALPVFVFLPQVREGTWEEETPETLSTAQSAGFVVIDMGDVYKGRDIASIRLAEWDDHPNRNGHELIASRMYDELQKRRQIIFHIVGGSAK